MIVFPYLSKQILLVMTAVTLILLVVALTSRFIQYLGDAVAGKRASDILLLQPVSTLALLILAIPFVFGPLREATMGFRVFVALGIGLVFTIIQRLLEPASLIYGFNPLLAVLTALLLCAMLGFYLMSRVRLQKDSEKELLRDTQAKGW